MQLTVSSQKKEIKIGAKKVLLPKIKIKSKSLIGFLSTYKHYNSSLLWSISQNKLHFRSEPRNRLTIFDHGLKTELTTKACLNDSSWLEPSFDAQRSSGNQTF